MVLCLNGLPIATIGLKNQFTGQISDHAREQFMTDRDPRGLLFTYKSRTLVYFAIDTDTVWMTTKLDKTSTRFLPFNKGRDGGAGNPSSENGHRTAYMWEEILGKDSLLDILGNFMHLQQEELRFGKNKVKKESLIFPRYHQLDVVRRLRETVKREGVGHNYLIQHSAGSGKSNTIGWLAHTLSSLHNEQDQNVFDSIIVISDRRVIDRQLQDVIYQFRHKQGVVVKIDRDSEQLALALKEGAKIIITTLQKFPFVLDKIEDLLARKYAVLIDEAHSSQSGEASDKMKTVLTANAEKESEENLMEEDRVAQIAIDRQAKQKNICFFAFTATTKPKTLQAFGTIGADGKPHEWHLYSMRQAIEENFILDVLQNYTTYKTFFKLTKQIEEDPRFDKKKARRAIARFIDLHPYNLAQKVEVIIEHFKSSVMHKIGGQAKAMIITSSRLHAVRYKYEVDKYLREKRRLGDKSSERIKALVAFSGTVKDDFGIEHTEANINGFSESELPERFAGEEYQLLLVADKYQTGFDQPLLHTMYVDKKLSGVRAVQTLSRLNRIYPGKDDTFVLDFVNEAQEIQQAFQSFNEGTTLEEATSRCCESSTVQSSARRRQPSVGNRCTSAEA
jgi:type I restriction enzyme R subunit